MGASTCQPGRICTRRGRGRNLPYLALHTDASSSEEIRQRRDVELERLNGRHTRAAMTCGSCTFVGGKHAALFLGWRRGSYQRLMLGPDEQKEM